MSFEDMFGGANVEALMDQARQMQEQMPGSGLKMGPAQVYPGQVDAGPAAGDLFQFGPHPATDLEQISDAGIIDAGKDLRREDIGLL